MRRNYSGMYTQISELKERIEFLLQNALERAKVAIDLAERNNLTDEQWFIELETAIGYAACQDHNKNKKC